MNLCAWLAAALLSGALWAGESGLERGKRLMDQGRHDEAAEALEREQAENPGSADTLKHLGWAHWHAGRPQQARRAWRLLLQLDPKHPVYLRLNASIEDELGDHKAALKLAGAAREARPSDPDVAVVLAKALLNLGREDAALAVLAKAVPANPRHRPARFLYADQLNRRGRHAEARVLLERLVREEPASVPYRRTLASSLYGLGHRDEAVAGWKALSAGPAPDPDSLRELGLAYWDGHRYDLAWRTWGRLAELKPDSPSYLDLVASAEVKRREYARAEALARAGLRLAPGHRSLLLTLGQALASQGRAEESLKIARDLMNQRPGDLVVELHLAEFLTNLGRNKEALARLESLMRRHPKEAAYRLARADVLERLGREREAMAEWRALAERKSPEPRALKMLALQHWKREEFAKAEDYAKELVRLDPSDPDSLKVLANVKFSVQDYPEALELSQRALRLLVSDKDAALLVGRALFAMERDAEALTVFSELAKEHPNDPPVLFNLTEALVRSGRHEETLPYYDRLVAAEPAGTDWSLVYLKRRARALRASGRFEEAVAEWKKLAARTPPDDEAARSLLGDARVRGDTEGAVRWARALTVARPEAPTAWLSLSEALSLAGRHGEAAAAADKALAADPGSLEARLRKAEILEELGRLDEAEAAVKALLEAAPGNPRPIAALSRLAERRGDYGKAIEFVRGLPRAPADEPYLEMQEARLLADSGRLREALKTLQPLAAERVPAVPALFYNGVARFERDEFISQEAFAGQMKALKAAGYEAVTASELVAARAGKGSLPPKPVLIMFDDAPRDAFRFADPVLAAVGYKATVFVHVSRQREQPYHAGLEDLRRWRETGRWELQPHGADAHEPVPLDAKGRTGRFLTNRMWLEAKGRRETYDEFAARLERDYVSGKRELEQAFPGAKAVAFAYPYGDYGQGLSGNEPKAAELNARLAARHFGAAFVSDSHGFNPPQGRAWELRRLEVRKGVSAQALLSHLTLEEPWARASLMEAALWAQNGHPGRALRVYDRLAKAGVKDPELELRRAVAMAREGDRWGAAQLLASAKEAMPEDDRARSLHQLWSRRASWPRLGGQVTGTSDNFERESTRAGLGFGSGIRAVRLDGAAARGRYSAPGMSGPLRSDELEARAAWRPRPALELSAGLSRRTFRGAGPGRVDGYAAGLGWKAGPDVRLLLDGEAGGLDTADSLATGRRYRRGELGAEWTPGLDWTATASAGLAGYNDGNTLREFRGAATRRLWGGLSAGYALWLGDSDIAAPDYWTPRRLHQHMGVATYELGTAPRGAARLPMLSARLRYMGGYGWQEAGERAVHSGGATLTWRLADFLSLNLDGLYSQSPTYISRRATVGVGLGY